jgi:DNA-binding IscR family transcriptional regulator
MRGGYVLARKPEDTRLLQIVDAIEREKPPFDCREVRGRCAAFGNRPPARATGSVCAILVAMLRAEKAARDTLAGQSLADVAQVLGRKAPADFSSNVQDWIGNWIKSRVRKSAVPTPPSSFEESIPRTWSALRWNIL